MEKELELIEKLESNLLDLLLKSCPRCGSASANASNPSGRCAACLKKLSTNKKKVGHYLHNHKVADDALRRQKGKNGTASKKSSGLGSRKEIIGKVKSAEKKTGQVLSPDRKDNSKGYASGNVRMVPPKLNRGRHHVDGKKLRAWQKRLKKSDVTEEEFYTYLLAKASDNKEAFEILAKNTPEDVTVFMGQTELGEFVNSYLDGHCELEKAADTTTFARIEDKFIVPVELKQELNELLNKNLKPDYLDEGIRFNGMRSIYFDSANCDLMRHHLAKAASRFKIRIRQYVPDGLLAKSSGFFLEVKAKNSHVSDKFRFKISQESLDKLFKGEELSLDEVTAANPNSLKIELASRLNDINTAISHFTLRPTCEVTYLRKAFADGEFRVTVDDDIKYKPVSSFNHNELVKNLITPELVDTYVPEKHIILEVKHQGTVPTYLTEFLTKHNIQKASFSKYCYSMSKIISQ